VGSDQPAFGSAGIRIRRHSDPVGQIRSVRSGRSDPVGRIRSVGSGRSDPVEVEDVAGHEVVADDDEAVLDQMVGVDDLEVLHEAVAGAEDRAVARELEVAVDPTGAGEPAVVTPVVVVEADEAVVDVAPADEPGGDEAGHRDTLGQLVEAAVGQGAGGAGRLARGDRLGGEVRVFDAEIPEQEIQLPHFHRDIGTTGKDDLAALGGNGIPQCVVRGLNGLRAHGQLRKLGTPLIPMGSYGLGIAAHKPVLIS
jgi:hypothetical protein